MKSLSLNKPHLITVIGPPGSGKTFFASNFADTFNIPYLDFQKITDIVPDAKSAGAIAEYMIEQLLKSHQSILLEGRGNSRVQRQAISMQAKKAGYESLFVWVQTENSESQRRSKKAGIDEKVYESEVKKFTAPSSTEHYIVISGRHTYSSQAKTVLKKLSEPRVEKAKSVAATRTSNRIKVQ